MRFTHDPSPWPPGEDDDSGDPSRDVFPTIQTDRPFLNGDRPSAPPLRIAHVMLFTASSAAILAVQRLWLSELGASEKSATFLGLVTLYAVAAGPALAAIVLCPLWRSRGYRFPVHPGEWLLLLNGCVVVLGMARAMTRYIEDGPVGGNPLQWLVASVVGLTHLAIVLALWGQAFRRGNHRAAWRWLFFVFGAAILLRDLVGSFLFDARLLDMFLYTAASVFVCLVIAVLCDVRSFVRLPWTHAVGVLTLAVDEGTSLGWWVWIVFFQEPRLGS